MSLKYTPKFTFHFVVQKLDWPDISWKYVCGETKLPHENFPTHTLFEFS